MANNNTDFIKMGEDFFKKAPSLPENARQVLVKITPWIALIFGILSVIGGLGVIGISPIALFGGLHATGRLLISGALTIATGVLMLMAYPKLMKNRLDGWTLLFWSEMVSFVASLIAGSILSAIIGALIGFYLLYQIKSHYK